MFIWANYYDPNSSYELITMTLIRSYELITMIWIRSYELMTMTLIRQASLPAYEAMKKELDTVKAHATAQQAPPQPHISLW